jgi:hypothetical protein
MILILSQHEFETMIKFDARLVLGMISTILITKMEQNGRIICATKVG